MCPVNIAAASRADLMQIPTRDLIVMHLFEARRLAAHMKQEIDTRLFAYMIEMAAEVAQEGRIRQPQQS
ncbi:hypothetical protein [Chelativorans sp. AA-79]|uniref:hypothetical protein n=1 Tax=Chelativorans sp. AA-79 TaxID=3028735 RepID=UPI0023F629A4|nr:hypothetical protein [Chelativorans sp. AA-79]WEX07520.1 hypothetical protein PVE73_15500 [Chelativorans sp. AA-79]